jgi:mRNA (2'-O-methyladenosine-N6-)-methyltransferase
MTVNRRMFKSHGYYLQHAKEVCMVARKNHSAQELQQQQAQQPDPPGTAAEGAAAADGSGPGRPAGGGISSSSGAPMPGWQGLAGSSSSIGGVGSDIILSERRGQSQKPEEVYELVESLVPGGEAREARGLSQHMASTACVHLLVAEAGDEPHSGAGGLHANRSVWTTNQATPHHTTPNHSTHRPIP